jgi:hypothetical protein
LILDFNLFSLIVHYAIVTMASSADANTNMDLDTATTANVSLSRREEEMLRRDRTLAETLLLMDNCRPIVSYNSNKPTSTIAYT